MKKINIKEKICIFLLVVFPIFAALYLSTGVFGNTIDWLSQHVILADCIRNTMIKQGTLFPSFIPELMGGCNFYEISYYGYLRPDVLVGVLFPSLDMANIVQTYSVFLICLTGVSAYVFLKENRMSSTVSWILSFVVICSSLFYQSHKQIMFANILPFVFLGLISIDHFLKTDRIIWFVVCGTLIVFHSYFYSFSSFIVCLIYFIYKKPERRHWVRFLLGCICIGLCTSIITIPTLSVLIQNAKSVSSTHLIDLFIPFLNLKGLLYDPYGLGLSYSAWLCIVLGLSNKESRNLSMCLILIFLCPIFCYALNGFLYVRTKILIPFMPLVIYQMGLVYQISKKMILSISYLQFGLLCLPILVVHSTLIILDAVLSIFILLYFQFGKWLLLVISFLCLVLINPVSSFINPNVMKHARDYERQEWIQKHINFGHRMAIFGNHQLVNETFKQDVLRASGYTSSYNSSYNSFLFDTLGLNVPINNRVSMLDDSNPFYLQMMGIDTIITKKEPPMDYVFVDKYKDESIYRNEKVFPIAYATNKTLDTKSFKQVPFPYNLDMLANQTVVDGGSSSAISHFLLDTHLKKVPVQKNIVWDVKHPSKIVAVQLNVENKSKTQPVSIVVNGVKNMLSKPNSRYFNENKVFHYVLSSNVPIEKLELKLSKGNYEIKEAKIYSLKETDIYRKVDPMHIKSYDASLIGSIDAQEDGYFVTSIPFKKGFTLKIDNRPVDIKVVNTAFVGSEISKGHHEIELIYNAPGRILALCLTGIGIMFTILVVIQEEYKKWKLKKLRN